MRCDWDLACSGNCRSNPCEFAPSHCLKARSLRARKKYCAAHLISYRGERPLGRGSIRDRACPTLEALGGEDETEEIDAFRGRDYEDLDDEEKKEFASYDDFVSRKESDVISGAYRVWPGAAVCSVCFKNRYYCLDVDDRRDPRYNYDY